MSATPIIDPVLGSIADNGDAWFAATLFYSNQSIKIFLPAVASDSACVDPSALQSARKIAQDLVSTVESALGFLATFRGFGGLSRVREIFSLHGVVTTSKADGFWLEFHCSEDRDPEAIWRVEFQGGVPTAHGRDD